MNRIIVEVSVTLTPMRGKASPVFSPTQLRRVSIAFAKTAASSRDSRAIAVAVAAVVAAQPQTDAHATLVG